MVSIKQEHIEILDYYLKNNYYHVCGKVIVDDEVSKLFEDFKNKFISGDDIYYNEYDEYKLLKKQCIIHIL